MEREFKTIVTPIGKQEVVIKSWLTGGEKRSITNALIENAKFNPQNAESMELSGDVINKAQDAALENIIISIGGVKENIVKTILDMRSEDYEFIVNAVNNITNGVEDENLKKK